MADGYLATATSSASDNWPTPPEIVAQAAAEFGPFDLDPAADPANAKAPQFYTAEDDGLRRPWHGRVWMNPPYGRTIGQWMRKARTEVETGRAELVVCLVPVRVDARWWQKNVIHAQPRPLVRFWPKRLRYVKDWDAPFASATIVYGHEATGRRHGAVARQCPVCGSIFWPVRADAIACSRKCRRDLGSDRIAGTDSDQIEPIIRSIDLELIRSVAAGPDGLRAFLKIVRDDPGRAQMAARDYLNG